MSQTNVPAPPRLSVVVALISGRPEHLEGCLAALLQQVDPPPMEIIVACDARLRDSARFQARYPTVQFLSAAEPSDTARTGWIREHHDQLRALGLHHARGEIIALLQDNCFPEAHWCATLVREHAASHAAIGGAIENGTDRLLNWALYFCDFGRYQNPIRRGPATYVSDCNISYKRRALEKVAEMWKETYHEASINWALQKQGETLWLCPEMVVWQQREKMSLTSALRERYVWGRSFAGKRAARIALGARIFYATFSCLLPLLLFARMGTTAFRRRLRLGVFIRAVPMIMLLTAFWSLGELVGYVTGRPVTLPRKAKGEQ